MAYQSHQGHIFTNSEELEIKPWTGKKLTLQNTTPQALNQHLQ